MSKIICDICGTSYPETADCCPICGCTKDAAAAFLGENLAEETVLEEPVAKSSAFAPKKKKEIFDFDEVNALPKARDDEIGEEDEEDYDEDYDEEEEEEEVPRQNTVVVVLLTILIAALLVAAGFIFFRYFLPNMDSGETVPETTVMQVQETTLETTEPVIPCEYLAMLSSSVAELNAEGQNFLLNVIPKPENTTEKIIYTSADESIATVTEDGRITAVSEGETKIFISCGTQSMECPVIVKYVEETVPPTTEVVETKAAVETEAEAEEETEPAATEAEKKPAANSNVTLKLKKTDIMLGVYLQFQLVLDCDLAQDEVEWSSEHPHIATVDEQGVVTAVKNGTTAIIAKYGDQQVQCLVRCG